MLAAALEDDRWRRSQQTRTIDRDSHTRAIQWLDGQIWRVAKRKR